MSDLLKRTSGLLEPTSTTEKVGGGLLKAGAIGGGLWIAAGFIPFITFPMLLVLLIIGGVAMKLFG